MARADRIKEEIGWLKLVFGIFLAADVSLIGWLAQNWTKVEGPVLALTVVAIVVLGYVVAWMNSRAYRRFAQLEEA